MRICATSNGEKRVQVLIPVVQGLSQKQRQSFERSVEVWKDWIPPKKELATLDEKLPPVELFPAKRKKQSFRSNEERCKQRGVWVKSASRGQHVGFVVMSTDTFGKF